MTATDIFTPGVSQAQTASAYGMGYQLKLFEMTLANISTAVEHAQDLMGAKSPTEFAERLSRHTQQQFDVMVAQGKELMALGLKPNAIGEQLTSPENFFSAPAVQAAAVASTDTDAQRETSCAKNDVSELTPADEVLLLHVME